MMMQGTIVIMTGRILEVEAAHVCHHQEVVVVGVISQPLKDHHLDHVGMEEIVDRGILESIMIDQLELEEEEMSMMTNHHPVM